MISAKPRSPASERNRGPILAVLRRHFADRRRVLEIGSGTGQHAVHFAQSLPNLEWQPTDRAENLDGIRAWCAHAALANLRPPRVLDVNDPADWASLRNQVDAAGAWDAAFTANTLHIMSWSEVERGFRNLPAVLAADATLVIYGPFCIGGRHTSDSNAAFDRALRAAAPHRGLRDLEAVDALARAAGLRLREDCPMPANNRCLVWQRQARS